MRILAVVPARGGSKRLPGKNLRLLGEQPLIGWTLSQALSIEQINHVMVSTDDPKIAEVSQALGADVPWLRPAELATDTASSVDVVLHALNYYEQHHGKVDGVLLLQPTSPFRKRSTIVSGIEQFRSEMETVIIGVSLATVSPLWYLTLEKNKLKPIHNEKNFFNLRSQDLPEFYIPNGAFYLASPERLRTTRSFYGNSMSALIMNSPEESIDIDTEADWQWAEFTLHNLMKGAKSL